MLSTMHTPASVDEWLQCVSNKKILLIAEQDFFVDKFWSKLSERTQVVKFRTIFIQIFTP